MQPDSSTVGLVFKIRQPVPLGKKSESTRGFYHLRILPKIPESDIRFESGFAARLANGDWVGAKAALCSIVHDQTEAKVASAHGLLRDLPKLKASVDVLLKHKVGRYGIGYFHKGLRRFRRACRHLRRSLEESNGFLSCDAVVCVREVGTAIDEVLSNHSPAPVYLDDGNASESFSFIVAADLQYHENNPELLNFLAYLEGDPDHKTRFHELPIKTQTLIPEAKFVLLAGDLCDGAAGSVRRIFGNKIPAQIFFNGIGILPPSSPYSHTFPFESGAEMLHLREHLNSLPKPVFAVPGNHDGFVGYGGVISVVLDFTAEFLNEFPWIRHNVARWIFHGNEFIPHGFKFYAATTMPPVTAPMIPRQSSSGHVVTPRQGDGMLSWFYAPRYDGLVEWRWYFGPLNVAFKYRDRTFVGLNSYNLSQPDRAGVGAVASSWGGGIQPRDAIWLHAVLDGSIANTSSPGDKRFFVFMHHDPRGFTPVEDVWGKNVEPRTPAFDAADSWGNYLTVGYAGLQYSPAWGLYWPIVTPLTEYILHRMFHKDRFNREWTQGYGEEQVVRLIDSLRNGPMVKSANVFFGHNDVPIDDLPWRLDGELFPIVERPRSVGRSIVEWLFKTRCENRPTWSERVDSGVGDVDIRVTRLDDVANIFEFGSEKGMSDSVDAQPKQGKHGFHLVIVDAKASPPVQVKHISVLPRK